MKAWVTSFESRCLSINILVELERLDYLEGSFVKVEPGWPQGYGGIYVTRRRSSRDNVALGPT